MIVFQYICYLSSLWETFWRRGDTETKTKHTAWGQPSDLCVFLGARSLFFRHFCFRPPRPHGYVFCFCDTTTTSERPRFNWYQPICGEKKNQSVSGKPVRAQLNRFVSIGILFSQSVPVRTFFQTSFAEKPTRKTTQLGLGLRRRLSPFI